MYHIQQCAYLYSPSESTAGLFHRSRVTGHGSQVTSHRSQVTGHRSQVTGHRSQVTGHGSQVTGHRSRVTSHRSQVTGYRSRVTGHGSQVTGHRSRVTGHGSQVTGRGSRVTDLWVRQHQLCWVYRYNRVYLGYIYLVLDRRLCRHVAIVGARSRVRVASKLLVGKLSLMAIPWSALLD
jgi:hypothetical protein